MTSPFLRALRQACPNARITLVVKPSTFNLVEKCPHIDRLLTFSSWDGFNRLVRPRRIWGLWKFCRSYLHDTRWDWALHPRWDVDSYGGTLLTYMSGAARRAGWSEKVAPWKSAAAGGLDPLFTDVFCDTDFRPEVERNLDLLRHLGIAVEAGSTEMWTDSTDEKDAENIFATAGIGPHDRAVALGVGTRTAERRWPFDRYMELAARLVRDAGFRPILIGGPAEAALGQAPKTVLDLRGKTTVRQDAALLRRCALFIGNESGALHFAAAVGIPVIGISCQPKTSSPFSWPCSDRFKPWSPRATILRPEKPTPPCTDSCIVNGAHCITAISVDDVLKSVPKSLSSSGYDPAPQA